MNSTVKNIVIGLVLTGLAVGTFFGVKRLINGSNIDNLEGVDEETAINESNSSSAMTPKTKVTLNPYKWLNKGINDIAVKYAQWAMNGVIKEAKRVKSLNSYKQLPTADKNRVNAVASLNYLNADGNFGAKTEAVTSVILGKKGANLCEVRTQRRAFNLKYGLKDPYEGWSNLCQTKQVDA